MVRLRCDSFWERLLIPAFVFFFEKLYPFRWVNDPHNPMAAAAGGCILIQWEVLAVIGGIASIRDALIDDCALAKVVKHHHSTSSTPYTPIWIGLSDRTFSLRPYLSLQSIWEMVARSAYTQLNYSSLLLIGTLLAMAIVYFVPPLSLGFGIIFGNGQLALIGGLGWLLMTIAYFPTVRFYQCSPLFALALPGIAFLYTLMTINSAWRHWRGKGGAWKGRVYER
jgi:hopene-associated glycosyltransferase HpnB